jgi:hypothetical protein
MYHNPRVAVVVSSFEVDGNLVRGAPVHVKFLDIDTRNFIAEGDTHTYLIGSEVRTGEERDWVFTVRDALAPERFMQYEIPKGSRRIEVSYKVLVVGGEAQREQYRLIAVSLSK